MAKGQLRKNKQATDVWKGNETKRATIRRAEADAQTPTVPLARRRQAAHLQALQAPVLQGAIEVGRLVQSVDRLRTAAFVAQLLQRLLAQLGAVCWGRRR